MSKPENDIVIILLNDLAVLPVPARVQELFKWFGAQNIMTKLKRFEYRSKCNQIIGPCIPFLQAALEDLKTQRNNVQVERNKLIDIYNVFKRKQGIDQGNVITVDAMIQQLDLKKLTENKLSYLDAMALFDREKFQNYMNNVDNRIETLTVSEKALWKQSCRLSEQVEFVKQFVDENNLPTPSSSRRVSEVGKSRSTSPNDSILAQTDEIHKAKKVKTIENPPPAQGKQNGEV